MEETNNTGFAEMDATADAAARDREPHVPEPEAADNPASREPHPAQTLLLRLRAASLKASGAKKRLMLDELADAVVEAIDAIIAATAEPAQD